jgi:hypothetical protein
MSVFVWADRDRVRRPWPCPWAVPASVSLSLHTAMAHPLAHDLPPSSVPVPVRQPVALPIPIRVRPPVALPIGMPVTQRGEWLTDYFSTDEGLARRVLDTVTLPGETFCIRLDQNPSFRRPLRAVEGSRIYQSS